MYTYVWDKYVESLEKMLKILLVNCKVSWIVVMNSGRDVNVIFMGIGLYESWLICIQFETNKLFV